MDSNTGATNSPQLVDMQAKGSLFEQMDIIISRSPTFTQSAGAVRIARGWVNNNGWAPKDKEGNIRERHFNFMLRVKDAVISGGYSAYIELDQSMYNVLKSDDLDAEGNATNTYTLQFALKGTNKFKIKSKGLAMLDQNDARRWRFLFQMSILQQSIEDERRYIQVRIPDYKKENVTKRFDKDMILNILTNCSGLDPALAPGA
ncbi:hypothetical protein H2200_005662 [Cladophialophora chaetospira]|uniref:Uncharacterized protein n=1 Tax=Cladophialophora chaetospira TaxID=386627 RepID=A0AA38X9M8_9EURO|nr:hypothetical protein H2200_005662 [Cladophialophora chaetospira]